MILNARRFVYFCVESQEFSRHRSGLAGYNSKMHELLINDYLFKLKHFK